MWDLGYLGESEGCGVEDCDEEFGVYGRVFVCEFFLILTECVVDRDR